MSPEITIREQSILGASRRGILPEMSIFNLNLLKHFYFLSNSTSIPQNASRRTLTMYLSSLKPLVENICRILVSKFSWTSVQTVTISTPAPTPTPKQTLRFTPSNHNTTTNNVPQNPDFLSLIPPNSWDSHMHILDPLTFPLSPSAHYTPSPALLSTALTTLTQTLHLPNLVLVQPSIYAHDNSCLLSALRTLGPERGRGVVSFDPQTIDASTLREWHVLGVRGVRINLQSVGLGQSVEAEELETMLKRYADVIRPLGWVLQLYVPLEMAVSLERIVPGLGVKVVLDHFGSPDLSRPFTSVSSTSGGVRGVRNPYTIPGFPSLITLLQNGNTYIKISAPYRLTSPNPHQNQPPPNSTTSQDLDAIGRELIKVAGMNRVVFASDWPHTRFEGLDIKPFVKTVMEWCEWDEGLIERVFRGNAEVLWGVEGGEKET